MENRWRACLRVQLKLESQCSFILSSVHQRVKWSNACQVAGKRALWTGPFSFRSVLLSQMNVLSAERIKMGENGLCPLYMHEPLGRLCESCKCRQALLSVLNCKQSFKNAWQVQSTEKVPERTYPSRPRHDASQVSRILSRPFYYCKSLSMAKKLPGPVSALLGDCL